MSKFCKKNDHGIEDWNRAFPDKPKRFIECGFPLPCPYHTVIIETAGPKVDIPKTAGLSQKQRKRLRELAVRISYALE